MKNIKKMLCVLFAIVTVMTSIFTVNTQAKNIKPPQATQVVKVYAAKNGMRVKWQVVNKVSGYQIQTARSKDFKKEKTRNTLTDEHIEKIFNAYVERKDIEKYAHLASFEEIKENDFNLNIPRYVDTFEEEEEINIDECFKELAEIDKEEEALNKELNSYFKELGLSFMLGKGE